MHTRAPFLRIDGESFDPWSIQAVEHSLMSHPLLQLDSIMALGQRLEAAGRVRTHSGEAQAGTPFNTAPSLHPNRKGAAATLGDIANANAWLSLLFINTDPLYRTLVAEVLDEVRALVEPKDPGMSYRSGYIFVTSPRAVTPFHLDSEHNFILQVVGRKRVYVWDPLDRSVVAERALELFLARRSRELVCWSEELRSKAVVFDLEPGQGGYMPSTSPHMVENGDGPSVTVSFTYFTKATRRRSMLYRANHQLRRAGLSPRPVGESALRDAVVHPLMAAYSGSKDLFDRLRGRPVPAPAAPFAIPLYT